MELSKTVTQIIDLIKDKKGIDITVIDIRGLSSLTDYFVLCTSDSDPKTRAISNHLKKELSKEKVKPIHIEGLNHLDWVLMDYSDIVVHIFKNEVRDFYKIEKLWADAKIKKIEND